MCAVPQSGLLPALDLPSPESVYLAATRNANTQAPAAPPGRGAIPEVPPRRRGALLNDQAAMAKEPR